jgi:hypothetical protein
MTSIYNDNIAFRKQEFKKGLNSDSGTRRRNEEATQIRKNKRNDKLSKRRKENTFELYDNNSDIDHDWIKGIYSHDPDTVLQSLVYIRKKLSQRNNPPIGQVVSTGIVPKILEYVSYIKYPKHQIEATWILTNMISGDSDTTCRIVNGTPIVNYMLKTLHTDNMELQDQAIWCLANIAGEKPIYCDQIIKLGGIDMLIQIVTKQIRDYSSKHTRFLSTTVWALQNIFRDTNVPLDSGIKLLPLISEMYKICTDITIISDLGWLLVYISKLFPDHSLFFSTGVVNPKWLELLNHKDKSVSVPILRVCGNMVAGSDETTQKILDMGLLDYITKFILLKDQLKETCWIISNITAGTCKQIQMVIDINLVPPILLLLRTNVWTIKKECMWVLTNLIMGANRDQIEYCENQQIIQSLCRFIPEVIASPKCIIEILRAVKRFLERGKKYGKLEQYRNIIEEYGLDHIEKLQQYNNEKIYSLVNKILVNYFDTQEEYTWTIPDTNSEYYQF